MPAVAVAVGEFWAAYGTYITYAAVVLSAYSANQLKRRAAQRAKDAYNESLQDRLNMVATADGVRSRLYGQVRNVDGVIFKAPWGTNSEYYTLVVALAGHECESIEKVYFNDQEVSLVSDGAGGFWVYTAPYLRNSIVNADASLTLSGGSGSVTLPHTPVAGSVFVSNPNRDGSFPVPYSSGSISISLSGALLSVSGFVDDPAASLMVQYQYSADVPKARIWKYLGTPGQDIGTDLLQSRFPSLVNTSGNSDRFAGITCLVAELQYDQDAFPTGVPSITGLVRGAKINDPRTGLTAWGQNPSLIARDWSLYAYGGGCSTTEIVDAAITSAANACDTSTAFSTPAGTETRPLYQCDIVCRLDAPPDGWLNEIVESMAGKWGWSGGQLTLVAGVYRAPVLTITEDWISDAADMGIVKDGPLADAVNVYRPSIANADAPVDGTTGVTAAYAMVPMPEVRSAAYITADGRELPREVSLSGIVHNVHAQHACSVFLRDGRFAMTLSLPCKMHAWRLKLFEVVYVTLPMFGFVAQQFEVIGWQFSLEKGILLTLKKFDASIFDLSASFPLPNAALNTSLVLPWVVPLVAGLAATSGTTAQQDGTQQSRVDVTWTATTSQSVSQSGKIEIQYTEAAASLPVGDWPNVIAEGGATGTKIFGLRAGKYYLLRARAINTLGVRSAWCLVVLHQVAGAQALGGDNLLLNSSFEVDANADGLADSWSAYSLGTTGTITRTTPTGGLFGAKLQRLAANGLAATAGDRVGITQTVSVSGAAGQQAVLSAYLLGGTGTPKAVMQVDWRNASNVSQGISTTGEFAPGTSALTRYKLADTIPATTVSAIVTLWMANRTGGTGSAQLDVDAVQLEIGGVMTGYAPNTAEILAGAVATTQLAASATTEVYVTTPGSAVACTALSHVPDGFGFNTQIMSTTFTPSASGIATVTVNARATYTSTGAGGYGEWSVQDAGGTYDTWKVAGLNQTVASGNTYVTPVSATRAFNVTGGVTYTLGFYANKLRSGDTFSFDNMEQRVEVIKR